MNRKDPNQTSSLKLRRGKYSPNNRDIQLDTVIFNARHKIWGNTCLLKRMKIIRRRHIQLVLLHPYVGRFCNLEPNTLIISYRKVRTDKLPISCAIYDRKSDKSVTTVFWGYYEETPQVKHFFLRDSTRTLFCEGEQW